MLILLSPSNLRTLPSLLALPSPVLSLLSLVLSRLSLVLSLSKDERRSTKALSRHSLFSFDFVCIVSRIDSLPNIAAQLRCTAKPRHPGGTSCSSCRFREGLAGLRLLRPATACAASRGCDSPSIRAGMAPAPMSARACGVVPVTLDNRSAASRGCDSPRTGPGWHLLLCPRGPAGLSR